MAEVVKGAHAQLASELRSKEVQERNAQGVVLDVPAGFLGPLTCEEVAMQVGATISTDVLKEAAQVRRSPPAAVVLRFCRRSPTLSACAHCAVAVSGQRGAQTIMGRQLLFLIQQ